MSVYYDEIEKLALLKFKSKSFFNFSEEVRTEILDSYLFSAVAHFSSICTKDLTARNDADRVFNVELTDIEKEILATGIMYFWLNPRVIDENNLRNYLSTKDYSYHSQATLLKEMRILRGELKKEFKQMMIDYSYHTGDIENVGG